MATYQISIPGKGTFEVSGVNTEDAAWAALQQQMASTPEKGPDPLADMAKEYGPVDAGMIAAGKTMTDLWEGIKQPFGMGRSDADRKEADRLYAPLKAASPVSTALGESLPYVAAGGLAGAGRSLLGAAAR